MRWDAQTLDSLESGSPVGEPGLPLALPGAVVRTFDTPAFAGMTFFEIKARTVLNRVPAASKMPFRWTLNPYRGCSHACRYCLSPETPVLRADGRSTPIGELRVGDEIVGTRLEGVERAYVRTAVLAHWRTEQPAHRVTLADGTTLLASAEHRFLSERGWAFVAPEGDRAHLAPGTVLQGSGRFPEPPEDDADYRQGYLAGGLGTGADLDAEASRRSAGYLLALEGAGGRSAAPGEDWPRSPSRSWTLGYLAGAYDGLGTCSRGILRLSHDDPAVVARIAAALGELGFHYVLEPPASRPELQVVRLLGGLRERMRLLLTIDPASTAKRSLEGQPVRPDRGLAVVAVEPLGITVPMVDITTGTGDFIADGVVSHNCFARNTHTYLDLDAGEDFDTKVVVKVNAAERLRVELAAPRWSGEHVALGTNVDPYQRAEGRYALMPGILRAFRDARNSFSVLTKGSLVLRDLELIGECAEVTDVGVNVSVGSVDRTMWRLVEPGTPSPQKRLEVCRAFVDAGIGCGVLMAPVLPYLTDSDEAIDATVRAIADAGAEFVSPIALHLRPGAREWFLGWLAAERPALLPDYERLYGRGAYAPKRYSEWLGERVAERAGHYGIGRRAPARTRRTSPAGPVVGPTPDAGQGSLFG